MEIPYNDLFKKQNEKLLQATFKRGIINRINADACTADVMMIGNAQSITKNVPFSSAVNINTVAVGDKCRLDLFDETNPDDMIIAYTYGKATTSNQPIFSSGSVTVTSSGVSIPHQLKKGGVSQTPDIVGFVIVGTPLLLKYFSQTITVTTPTTSSGVNSIAYNPSESVYQSAVPDATNIYLQSVWGNVTVKWYVIKF